MRLCPAPRLAWPGGSCAQRQRPPSSPSRGRAPTSPLGPLNNLSPVAVFLYPEASGDRGRCFVTFHFFPACGSQRWLRGTTKSVQFSGAGSLPRLGTPGGAVGCPGAGPRLGAPSSTSRRTGRGSQGPRRRRPSCSSHCKARKGQRGAGIASKGPSVLRGPCPRRGKTQGRERPEKEKGGERRRERGREGGARGGAGRGRSRLRPRWSCGSPTSPRRWGGALSPAWAPGEGLGSSRGRRWGGGRGRRRGEKLSSGLV